MAVMGKMETVTLETIHKDLEFIKNKVIEIEKHMVDVDTVLTPEEERRLEESIKEYKMGKTTSLEDFEKEMSKNV